MKYLKQLSKNVVLILAALVVLFIKLTSRRKYIGTENLKKAKEMAPNANYALAIWHQNLFCGVMCLSERIVSMTSLSKDGEVAAKIASWIANVHPTRGSSSRGGRAAMNELIRISNEKKLPVGLTVDGPRGPKYLPKRGIFKIAHEGKMPIIPYFAISSRTKVLPRSWDKFRLSLPFSSIFLYYGEPILIEELTDESLKSYSQLLTEKLHQLEQEHFKKYPKHQETIKRQE